MSGDAALGLALGAGRIVATLASGDSEPNQTVSTTLERCTPDYVLETALDLAEQLRHQPVSGDSAQSLTSVGAAVPGHIDHANGTVVYGYNLASQGEPWYEQKFAAALEEAFGVPAAIDNDANCMALYQQRFGLGQTTKSFVVVYLAPDMSGLGSGIVIDRRIVRGSSGGAGEFGHVVVQPGGPRCPCGNRGCLEAVIGVETIVRNVNWGNPGQLNALHDLSSAAELAGQGDRRAEDTFRQAGRSFGQALSILVNLLNPPLIIIGGPEEVVGSARVEGSARKRGRARGNVRQSFPRSAQLFKEGYDTTLAEYSFAKLEDHCRIVIDGLTLEQAAAGAARLGTRDEIASGEDMGLDPN